MENKRSDYKKKWNGTNVKEFVIWMRNGVAISFTWLMLLLLVRNMIFGVSQIDTYMVAKLLAMVIGGVFLFTIFFLKGIIKNMGFLSRLTGFMLLFMIFEILCFYWMGIFTKEGTMRWWAIFFLIVMVLYGICIDIYANYSRKKGELYTETLQKYKMERNERNYE